MPPSLHDVRDGRLGVEQGLDEPRASAALTARTAATSPGQTPGARSV
jgi:hypothetical protein